MRTHNQEHRTRHTVLKTLPAVLCLLLQSCSFHAPELTFTGERTALETQILGTYNQVREDVWMVASVRSSAADSQLVISNEKREVLSAVQNREFNRDDVLEFKEHGVVGENLRGLLEILPTERYKSDINYQHLVVEIVAEENDDRRVVMNRIVAVNPSIQAASTEEVERAFARINQEDARAGDWLQSADGKWFRKTE